MSEERKLQFNPKAALEKTQQNLQIHELNERIKELEAHLELANKRVVDVYDPLQYVLDQMRDVNVNMHPLKANILEHWKNQVSDILYSLNNAATRE